MVGTYSIVTKENHYAAGSYCNDERRLPVGSDGNDAKRPRAVLHFTTQSRASRPNGSLRTPTR